MINIYIDDSGSRSIKDLDQPIYLLTAVCINNKYFKEINDDINKISEIFKYKIENTLESSFNKNTYTEKRAHKMSNLLTNLIVDKSFELHCSEIIRGDIPYIILDKEDRINTIKKVLRIVEKYNLPIFTIYCNKEDFSSKYGKNNNSEDLLNKNMTKIFIDTLLDYLTEIDEQACLIADEGNYTISNYIIPYIREIDNERISCEVMQKKSFESVNIQLADICAYTTNMSLMYKIKKDNYKHKNIVIDLFSLISDYSIVKKVY